MSKLPVSSTDLDHLEITGKIYIIRDISVDLSHNKSAERDLIRGCQQFFKDQKFFDLTLVASDGREIRAHRAT